MLGDNLFTEELLSKIEQLVKGRPALINEIKINKDTNLFR